MMYHDVSIFRIEPFPLPIVLHVLRLVSNNQIEMPPHDKKTSVLSILVSQGNLFPGFASDFASFLDAKESI